MERTRTGAWLTAAVLVFAIVGCSSSPPSRGPGELTASAAPPSPIGSAASSPSVPPAALAPVELQVVCDGTTTDIATPIVRARPDGVHLRFRNTSGLSLEFGIDDETGLAMLGDSIPAEGAAFVYALGTGAWQVHCAQAATRFVVVDPDGVYRSVALRCADASGTTGSVDYGEGARGLSGQLLDVARLELRGLQPGDVVDRGGYPAVADLHQVRVVRGGQVVAVVAYADDGHGGWLLSGTQACKGSNVTVELPPG